jgi:hypothetical protein
MLVKDGFGDPTETRSYLAFVSKCLKNLNSLSCYEDFLNLMYLALYLNLFHNDNQSRY